VVKTNQSELIKEIRKSVAKRCLKIASEMVNTDPPRHRTWEEICHAIMRELLGWGGL